MAKSSRTKPRSEVASRVLGDVIDSRRLFYFYHAARLGSYTVAEAYLDVAQPAITRQIQQLEADLKLQLLLRTGRGVTLTDAGKVLYRHAETIFEEMRTTRRELDQTARHPGGQVSIAASPSFMSTFMPEVVSRFVAKFPEVRLKVAEASTGQVYELLVNGQVDLAVVLYAPNSQKLTAHKLFSEPLVLVASPRHALAKEAHVTATQLQDLDLVLAASVHGSRAVIEDYFARTGVEITPKLEIDSLRLTTEILKSPKLCSILPISVYEEAAERNSLVAIPFKPALSRTMYLAHLRDRELPLGARSLLSEIPEIVKSFMKSGRSA